MASTDRPSSPTSLLWAHQLKIEHSHLLKRIKQLESTASKQESSLKQAVERTNRVAAAEPDFVTNITNRVRHLESTLSRQESNLKQAAQREATVAAAEPDFVANITNRVKHLESRQESDLKQAAQRAATVAAAEPDFVANITNRLNHLESTLSKQEPNLKQAAEQAGTIATTEAELFAKIINRVKQDLVEGLHAKMDQEQSTTNRTTQNPDAVIEAGERGQAAQLAFDTEIAELIDRRPWCIDRFVQNQCFEELEAFVTAPERERGLREDRNAHFAFLMRKIRDAFYREGRHLENMAMEIAELKYDLANEKEEGVRLNDDLCRARRESAGAPAISKHVEELEHGATVLRAESVVLRDEVERLRAENERLTAENERVDALARGRGRGRGKRRAAAAVADVAAATTAAPAAEEAAATDAVAAAEVADTAADLKTEEASEPAEPTVGGSDKALAQAEPVATSEPPTGMVTRQRSRQLAQQAGTKRKADEAPAYEPPQRNLRPRKGKASAAVAKPPKKSKADPSPSAAAPAAPAPAPRRKIIQYHEL